MPAASDTPAADAAAARKQSNLAYSFLSLDPERREAMAIFYDFCRAVDDAVDDREADDTTKAARIATWREGIAACYEGGTDTGPAHALAPVIQRFDIPRQHLDAILDGVSMDIGFRRFENFHALRHYCYGVASAVGLVSVRIFGCTHPRIDEYAETLGYALQFTNILRDVVEDWHEMGRIYLPADEMQAFGVTDDDLASPAGNPACHQLFQLQYYRAKHFFNKARRLLPESERQNLKAALIMAAFYEDILEQIARSGFQLTRQRFRLSKVRKATLLLRTLRSLKKPLPHRHAPGTAAIWGAGVAGLSAAIRLGLEGFTPTVYEARTYPGGRAHSLTDAPSGLTLDNGQHIIMGCYHEFLRFADTLGIRHKLDPQPALTVPYISPGGRSSCLQASNLPAPFHLLPGLFRFSELSTRDRLAILRLGLALRLGSKPRPRDTALTWLQRHRQTPGALRALWEPFCIAALNEAPAEADATLLYQTLKRSLFGTADDARIILSQVGLTELFLPEASLYLRAIGGDLHCSSQITTLHPEGQHLAAFDTKQGRHQADLYISALPWTALRSLLPEGTPLREQLAHIPSAPILSIHLLTDTRLFPDNPARFVGLLDSPVHWVFDRTHTLTQPQDSPQHLYAVVLSTAGPWMHLKSTEILDKLRAELTRYFPAAADMHIHRHLVYKSKDATFAARPGTEPHRPHCDASPWPNLLLAGDWVQTGLPATLEGAAQSGHDLIAALDKR